MVKIIRLDLENRVHRELPSGWSDLAKFVGYPLLAASAIVGSENCSNSPTSPSGPGNPSAFTVTGQLPNGVLPEGTTQTQFGVNTSKEGRCAYDENNIPYSSMTKNLDTAATTQHMIMLTGLSPGSIDRFVACVTPDNSQSINGYKITIQVASPQPGNGVTFTNYTVKTNPEGGIVNATMNLQKNGANVADVDITNSTINITPDKKIPPGTYYANFKSKNGGVDYRNSYIIIGDNTIKTPVEGDVNFPTRTKDLEILVNGFDFANYQSGTQFTEFGGGSRRWDVGANGEKCPEQHIYTTLYQRGGSSFVKVDPNTVAPEVWAQWMQNISNGTKCLKQALTGMHTAPDGRQRSGIAMATGGFCEPKIIVEGPDTPLPDFPITTEISVIFPVTDPVGGGIVNPGVYATYGPNRTLGKITGVAVIYDAKTNWSSDSAFLVDAVFYAMGGHPPKQGPGSGFNPIFNVGHRNFKFLPEVFTITSLLYNRMPGHTSTPQTPDFNSK